MHISQKVTLNTFIQIIAKTITVFFGFLTMVILTNYLGPSGYGDYMYVLTLVVFFGGFADWGTATIGVREAAHYKERQNVILSNIFMLRFFLALVGGLLMVLLGFFLPLKTTNEFLVRQGIFLGSFILILFAIKASFGIIFQTKLQMQKLAIADITASILIFLISWLFIYYQLGLVYLLIAIILSNLVAVILVTLLAIRTIEFKFQIDKLFLKSFIKEAFPMGIILLLLTVDNKIDTLMLGLIKGSKAVGIYAVSYRLYDVLILGAAYFMNSLLPVLSQFAGLKKWQKKIKMIYQKSFDILLVIGFLVAFLSFFFSPLMIKLITQQRFNEFFPSVIVTKILSLAIFLSYFNHLTGYTIVALRKQRWYFWIAGSALNFNVIFNLLVIPKFSYYGAATVTVLTEGLVLLVTSLLVFRLIKIFPSIFVFPKTVLQFFKQKGKIFLSI